MPAPSGGKGIDPRWGPSQLSSLVRCMAPAVTNLSLASLVQYLEDRTGVKVKIDVPLDIPVLSEQYAVNLWHVFQEALPDI